MSRTPQWEKKLGGHAGELYAAAELSKRGILNALLPENFSDDDIIFSKKDGKKVGYIQVKSYHPDRGQSWKFSAKNEEWVNASKNSFVVLVRLGSPKINESPSFWITTKREVGRHCIKDPAHGTKNKDRRIQFSQRNPRIAVHEKWENNWKIIEQYLK